MIETRTKSLIAKVVPFNLQLIPIYGTGYITSEVRNVKVIICRNTGNRRVVLTPLATGACSRRARC